MTSSEISDFRIQNQQIENSKFKSPKELVGWMGAMQAQDFSMSKWAVGLRLQNPSEKLIEEAYNKGEIIRTHLMRPTWHLVSSDDVYWLLALTAPKIKPTLKTREKQLELTEEIFSKSNQLLESILENSSNLTRDEIVKEFDRIKIRTNENRLSHLLFRAELDGLICSGVIKNNKLTYSLLSDRVPHKKILSRDESTAELAKRYFSSHGPATLRDFIWWSGLSVTDAKNALEMIKSDFISEIIDNEIFWMQNSIKKINQKETSVHLLPAFDEFLISYRDRSATIELSHNKKAISDNGIFRPIVVVNGLVCGIWKRTLIKNKVIIEINHFHPQNELTKNKIEITGKIYERFLKKDIQLVIDRD